MLGEDQRWGAAAAALGLGLYEPPAEGLGFRAGASFPHLERGLGRPASGPPKSSQWMYGTRRVGSSGGRPSRDIQILVLVHVVSVGSSTTTYTRTIARIDPPLLLGLALKRITWLERKLGATMHPFGDPVLDAAVRLDAREAKRAMILLTGRGGPAPGIAARFAAQGDFDFYVTDGSVDVHTDTGIVTDPSVLGHRADFAAVMAAGIADQSAWLPQDPARSALEGVFRTVAEASSLAFDAGRVCVHGELGGARVRIALESEPSAVYTTVTVDLPRNLGLGLSMKPQGSLQFLATFFGSQDIEVGDPAFDDRFVIKGTVPADVRAAFADPTLRRVIVELAHGAEDVRIDDARLFFRYPVPCTTDRELRMLVDHVRAAAMGFFPPSPADGPYR